MWSSLADVAVRIMGRGVVGVRVCQLKKLNIIIDYYY